MMRRFILALALVLAPVIAGAQSTAFAGRASVGADYKIRKGMHIEFEEELRSADGFSALGSLRTTLGFTYKPVKYVKLGVGYTLINPYTVDKSIELSSGEESSFTGFWYPRHRFFFDVSGHMNLGDFQFGVKERLQLTHRTGDFNVYQNTPDAFALKSRIYMKYKRWKAFEPTAYFEVRTALNDPWGSYQTATNDDGEVYYKYTPAGYTHIYNNRYRGGLKGDVNLGKTHTLSPYVLLDFCSDYEIDTNKAGTKLKSAGYEEVFRISLGLSYTVNF